ncbi:hypothetical protein [Sanguibacter antarcticus]|uniref:hypothetical protein n=1 Tax=Sanguibacter antarcticus TaxID=372484 RepID=UPI000BF3826B|nr:hypothetical protein [Sanguibacter antarcticus]
MIALVALAVSGCSVEVEPGQTPEASSGTIDLAVAETCDEGSDPQCVPIDGQYVTNPETFRTATVEDVVVAEHDGHSAVDLTFAADGEAVLKSLTQEVAQAGSDARLVMKIGDEIRSAVAVPEPVIGNAMTIPMSSTDSAQDAVDLILND